MSRLSGRDRAKKTKGENERSGGGVSGEGRGEGGKGTLRRVLFPSLRSAGSLVSSRAFSPLRSLLTGYAQGVYN